MLQFLLDNLLLLAVIVLCVISLALPYVNRRRFGPEVGPTEAVTLINKKNALVIDVRKPADFRKGRIANSVNIPGDTIQNRIGELSKDRPVVLVDQQGGVARMAARLLRGVGFKEVYVLENGLAAWRKEGLPLE